jgi:two-component system sensor kinase FixL
MGPEHDLATRAAQLEAILDSAVDAIITIDDRGIIESVNPATERMFGFAPSEVLGKNVNVLMPQPYRAEHDGYIGNYLRSGKPKIIGIGREVTGKRKNGTTFPIHLAVSEVLVRDRRLFTGVVRDITDLKAAQSRAEGIGRLIDDSLNEIFIFDAQTWKFLQVNRGARENLGYRMEELAQLTPVDIKPDHSNDSFAELIRPLLAGEKEVLEFETVHCRKDGSQYDAEIHLQLMKLDGAPCFVAIVLDNTRRKLAEKALRIQQRAVESASSGIIVTDARQDDNPIIMANPAMMELTGYSLDEVIGRNCRFLQGDEVDQEGIRELRDAVQEGRECRVLLRNYRKDGSMFWNDLRISPVRDENDEVTHFVGIQTDVTERRRGEQELERLVAKRTAQLQQAQSELIQKEKLATLGQVAGGIAHEIRNPLNVIKTSSYYLLNVDDPSKEKIREHLERIDRQVTMTESVITALSEFARMPDPVLMSCNLQDCLDDAIKTVALPKVIELSVEIPEDLPAVIIDRGQMPIVFRNLIRNARDAMPSGGVIRVVAEVKNTDVCISVIDSGVGIPAERLSRILEPLYSTKARGMGLGLAISRSIVETNEGKLTVESEVGKGSTFTVELKAAS